jgi:hypothetical protein
MRQFGPLKKQVLSNWRIRLFMLTAALRGGDAGRSYSPIFDRSTNQNFGELWREFDCTVEPGTCDALVLSAVCDDTCGCAGFRLDPGVSALFGCLNASCGSQTHAQPGTTLYVADSGPVPWGPSRILPHMVDTHYPAEEVTWDAEIPSAVQIFPGNTTSAPHALLRLQGTEYLVKVGQRIGQFVLVAILPSFTVCAKAFLQSLSHTCQQLSQKSFPMVVLDYTGMEWGVSIYLGPSHIGEVARLRRGVGDFTRLHQPVYNLTGMRRWSLIVYALYNCVGNCKFSDRANILLPHAI